MKKGIREMKVGPASNMKAQEVTMEGADGCTVRNLVSVADGAPTFSMRQFEVAPGGHTPRHQHAYEHEVYVLKGNGLVYEGDTAHPLKAGDVAFVKPNEIHQFRNTGDQPLQFLCMIPNSSAGEKVTVLPECHLPSDKQR